MHFKRTKKLSKFLVLFLVSAAFTLSACDTSDTPTAPTEEENGVTTTSVDLSTGNTITTTTYTSKPNIITVTSADETESSTRKEDLSDPSNPKSPYYDLKTRTRSDYGDDSEMSTLLEKTVFEHDEAGLLLSEKNYWYDLEEYFSYKIEYSYDENKKDLAVFVDQNGDQIDVEIRYEYNDKYELISKSQYSPASTDSLTSKTTYEYDIAGNVIIETSYESDGTTVECRDEYSYDSKGNLTEKISYEAGIEYSGKETYTYNEFGFVSVQNDYDESEAASYKSDYTYDSNNRLTQEHQEEFGEGEGYYKYTYEFHSN